MREKELKSRGFSVVEGLIAATVLGGLLLAIGRYFVTQNRILAAATAKSEMNQVMHRMTSQLHCRSTLTGIDLSSQCQGASFNYETGFQTGPFIPLKTVTGDPLFAGDSLDEWRVRTVCVRGTLNSLVTYVSRRESTTSPTALPSALRPGETDDWQPLFWPGTTFCENEVRNGVSAAASSFYFAPSSTFVNLSPTNNWVANDYNNYRTCNGSNYFPEYFAWANHGGGSFYTGNATCPTGYIALSPTYAAYVASGVPWTAVPSVVRQSADGRTMTAEIGAAFGNAQNSLFASARFYTMCLRVE